MRAMRAMRFGAESLLVLDDIPKPEPSPDRVLVRVSAAGVTPLDHTILTGHFPLASAPLVLGNEGAGVVEGGGDRQFPNGSRVVFTGPYGVFENGSLSEWVAVKREHLCAIPDNVGDTEAAGLPVAYLTAQIALSAAGFTAGKAVLAPAIGGSVGNAVTQLARAQGAKHAISSSSSRAKASRARELGFQEVVDLSQESLTDGVRRLTDGHGVDVVIDALGGTVLSEALGLLAQGGSLTTLGYAAGRKTTIDVTDLIWKGAAIHSFLLFAQPPSVWADAWKTIAALLAAERIRPIVARTFPLEDAADALRHLVEDRPLGRVIVTL